MINIEAILRVLVVGVLFFLADPPQGAEARSQLNSNAVTAEQTKPEAKANRHHGRRRHLRRRARTHHLDPGW